MTKSRMYGKKSPSNLNVIHFFHPFYFGSQYLLALFGRLLKKIKPDIVQIEYGIWSPITLQGLITTKIFSPQSKVCIFANKNTYLPKAFLSEVIKKFLFKAISSNVDACILGSNLTRKLYSDYLKIEDSKLYVSTLLGLDLSSFTPKRNRDRALSGNKFTVGFCGELCSRKGVPELVAAVKLINKKTGCNVKLLIAGRGELYAKLHSDSQRLPWREVLETMNFNEIKDFYLELDAFVCASRNQPDHQEHDGLALLEAMASGLPTIATRSGIIPEIADENSTIFIKENSSCELGQAILTLLHSSEKCIKMGDYARKMVENTKSLEAVSNNRYKIYQEILSANQ